ncbi:hypothetical protein V6Z11_A06G132200 [Gossypium hirsutum]
MPSSWCIIFLFLFKMCQKTSLFHILSAAINFLTESFNELSLFQFSLTIELKLL